jgi:hypothetical protein
VNTARRADPVHTPFIENSSGVYPRLWERPAVPLALPLDGLRGL